MLRHILLLCLLLVGGIASAAELTPSFTKDELDLANCTAYAGRTVVNTAPPTAVLTALGLAESRELWTMEGVATPERHFRIAFTKPVTIGTIITQYTGPSSRPMQKLTGRFVSVLKPNAPFPGDVMNNDQWIMLSPGEVKNLALQTQTRAIRFSDVSANEPHEPSKFVFAPSLCFAERYYSALNIGYAKKSMKQNAPEVLNAYWNVPQTLAGIVFLPANNVIQVQAHKTNAGDHPLVAPADQWKRLPDCAKGAMKVYRIDPPMSTRGVRLTNAPLGTQSNFRTVIPLVNLGDAVDPPTLQLPPPPFTFSYTMPMDGFVAIDLLEKKSGKLVRRLLAEQARAKGPVEEHWDLKDSAGEPIPPGEYTWKAIARPPFTNTYQTTVYNAGQPAWWAPPPGKGGGSWLADHGSPNCAAAVGDKLFFGSWVCEDGHAAIATDLSGNKLWGTHHISWGFRGPDRIVSDGKFAYLVNDALVIRVDPNNGFAMQTLIDFKHTNALPGNGTEIETVYLRGGAAVRDGKMYIAYNAPPESWLKTSFAPEALDPKRCLPLVYLQKGKGHRADKGDKIYAESEYDELMRLYATFLTEMTPEQTTTIPGMALPSSTQAYFGDAPKEGALGGTLTAAFKEPVIVGSILIPDGGIKVYALRPGATLPDGDPASAGPDDIDLGMGNDPGDDLDGGKFNEHDWIPLKTQGRAGMPAIALAPEGGVRTTALRFKADRLVYAQVMSRRFENITAQGEIVCAEGNATREGGWSVTREKHAPINTFSPAVSALVWQQPQAVRGVSLTYPGMGTVAVDVWTGAATGDPKAALADESMWREVGRFKPVIFKGYFPQEPTVRSVDFGTILTTRAVRIRFLAPSRTTEGKHTAGYKSLIAYRHLGNDPDGIPVVLNERITEYQLPEGDKGEMTVLRQLPFPKPNNLAFDQAGTLYCVSDGQIVTVPLAEGQRSTVVISRDKLEQPGSITFDATGLLYVSDCGPKVIKVFDPKTGALVRTYGKAGGQSVGKWDPERLDCPAQIAIDANGKLWVADQSYQPKRVMRFAKDGKPEQWYLGPTQYGGAGWLDEGDRRVINVNGMKFRIDWATGDWTLESILFRGSDPKSINGANPDKVVYFQGTRYLTGPSSGYFTGSTAVICVERDQVAVPMAALGNLGAWAEIEKRRDLAQAFGALERDNYLFCWWDKNGNGTPEADEVQVKEGFSRVNSHVGNDLSFLFQGYRLRPTGIAPNGIPMYDLAKLEKYLQTCDYASRNWTTADGRMFCIGTYLLDRDGQTQLWNYPSPYSRHDGFYASGFGYDRPPGVPNHEHNPIGHITLGKEEFFFTNSDPGDWYCYTGDGMLVGCIFGGPTGYGLRRWSMPEWEPEKVDLSDVRLGQEHYQGCVVKADDGKVYAVAGHNHASIVRIDGLEQMQRLTGTIVMTPDDLAKGQTWEVQKATLERVRQEAKVAKVPYLENPVEVNGTLDDWPDDLFVPIHDFWRHSLRSHDFITYAQGALAYNHEYLFVAIRTQDESPMRNTAQDPVMLFKSGDAADVMLGMDTTADPKRTTPAAGDLRILFSRVNKEPVAVLYKPVVPGATDAKRKRFASPVGMNTVDEVEIIPNAEISIATNQGEWGWLLEAAIPWTALRVEPPKVGSKLRGDLGIIQSDQNGVATSGRLYWSGKTQTVICDIPSETRLAPALWGDLYFIEPDRNMRFGPEEVDLLP